MIQVRQRNDLNTVDIPATTRDGKQFYTRIPEWVDAVAYQDDRYMLMQHDCIVNSIDLEFR